jgi:hypothetical protein
MTHLPLLRQVATTGIALAGLYLATWITTLVTLISFGVHQDPAATWGVLAAAVTVAAVVGGVLWVERDEP